MVWKLLFVTCCALIGSGAQLSNKTILPYAYSQADLANGLRLVTVSTDFPNIVAVYIVVQAGSRNEVEPGHTGFAHLFEHLMFKGTEKFPAAEYNNALKRMGAASNAFTTEDYTCYYTVISKEDLPSVMIMEADRFQNLKYTEADFKTEALAVLGEYNRNSSNPYRRLGEALLDTAFTQHPYKHTTMGLLKDIQDMPGQYEYSQKFFSHYYRPEYTTVILVGDVKARTVRDLAAKYWSGWKRGDFKPEIPVEPSQDGARANHVDWPNPTLPLVTIAFKSPAYSETSKDTAALDALALVAFSPESPLYQKLVIQERKAASLSVSSQANVDPSLFQITASVNKPEDLDYVRGQILETVKSQRERPVGAERLEAVKKHLRYQMALRMDNSQTIAEILAAYVALRRTPETIDKLYEQYARLTPEDIQNAAAKYLVENGRTDVTLTGPGDQ